MCFPSYCYVLDKKGKKNLERRAGKDKTVGGRASSIYQGIGKRQRVSDKQKRQDWEGHLERRKEMEAAEA